MLRWKNMSMLFYFFSLIQCEANDSSVCRSECHMVRRRLDVKDACKESIRNARGEMRTSTSNTCLSAVYTAFQDECQPACLAKLRSEGVRPEYSQNVASLNLYCGDNAPCRAGYQAGLQQTLDIFFPSEIDNTHPTSSRHKNSNSIVSTEQKYNATESSRTKTEEKKSMIQLSDSGGLTLELRYRNEPVLLHVRESETLSDSALSWCHANEPENPACPRILSHPRCHYRQLKPYNY